LPCRKDDLVVLLGLIEQVEQLRGAHSRVTIELYERGARREDNRPVVIPRTVALACAALSNGLEAYGPK